MNANDKKQFLAQYEEIHESLMRFCIVKSRGIMDPKDLANDVLLVGMENYHKLENKKALLSYLFTTANRICLNKIRRKKFSGVYNEDAVENIQDSQNNLEARVDISFLYAALDQLPPLQKEAVVLFEISDLPIKEIMVIQNSGASAVKQRIKRGREKLTELLSEKKSKKIAIVSTVLLSSNAFSMSNLDAYFTAIKELPLPLTGSEAASTISNFALNGAATNGTAAKIGSAVIKKAIFGSLAVTTIIGTSVLLTSQADPEKDETVQSSVLAATYSEKSEQPPLEDSKTIAYDAALSIGDSENTESSIIPEKMGQLMPFITDSGNAQSLVQILNPDLTVRDLPRSSPQKTFSSEELLSGDIFPMTGVETVLINNLGGNVELKTWDRDEIQIITNHFIVAKSPEDEALILKNLNFSVEKKGDVLSLQPNVCYTKMQKKGIGKKGFGSIEFSNREKAKYKTIEMNYTVMLPESTNLNVKGNYEKVTIPDMKGDFDARLIETELTMGSVLGKTELKLTYSNAELGSFNDLTCNLMNSDIHFVDAKNLKLSAKYSDIFGGHVIGSDLTLFDSKLQLKSFEKNLTANIKYSTLSFAKSAIDKAKITSFESKMDIPVIQDCELSMRYSSFKSDQIKTFNLPLSFQSNVTLTQVGTLSAESSKYSTYKISTALNDINLNSFEDDITIAKSNLSSMTFNGKYTTYNISLAQPANYLFNLNATYGSLDYGSLDLKIEDYEKTSTKKVIKGYFEGGTSTSAKLSFDCFESSIRLN